MNFLSRAIVFLLFLPFFVSAYNSLDVVINEIAWMGTKVEKIEPKNWWRYEWLELYNNTEKTISLDGWKIEFYQDVLDWSLDLKGFIDGKGYFLIVSSDKIFSYYDLNYSNLTGKLNNKGQKIILKDNLGNIIDEVDCYSYKKWFAGNNETKQTMERKNSSLYGSDFNNWQTSYNPNGTPGRKNDEMKETENMNQGRSNEEKSQLLLKQKIDEESIFKENSSFELKNYPKVILNEILPSPDGPDQENEWIEIFNPNNFEVDLSNWQISDKEGKTMIYVFPKKTKIPSQGYLVVSRLTTKIVLNNEKDGLNLIQPNGNIIDTVDYQNSFRNQSYNRNGSEWVWSRNLTPGRENDFSQLKEKNKLKTIKDEKKENEKPKEIATIGTQTSDSSNFLFVFSIALIVSVFSGIIILFLKQKILD